MLKPGQSLNPAKVPKSSKALCAKQNQRLLLNMLYYTMFGVNSQCQRRQVIVRWLVEIGLKTGRMGAMVERRVNGAAAADPTPSESNRV
jgi:hypothetical protein